MRRPFRSSTSCTTLPTWFVVLRVCVHHNTARQSCYCMAHLEGLPLSAHPVLYAAVWHASWWLLECPCSHGAKVRLRCTLRPSVPKPMDQGDWLVDPWLTNQPGVGFWLDQLVPNGTDFENRRVVMRVTAEDGKLILAYHPDSPYFTSKYH